MGEDGERKKKEEKDDGDSASADFHWPCSQEALRDIQRKQQAPQEVLEVREAKEEAAKHYKEAVSSIEDAFVCDVTRLFVCVCLCCVVRLASPILFSFIAFSPVFHFTRADGNLCSGKT